MTLPITRVALTPQDELLNPQGGRRMDLPGFDPEFVDFPDYIIRITDWIWHQRDVDLCERYYTDDCLVHTLTGDVTSARDVTRNTRAMMAAFPDRRLEPDNVIWSDEGEDGFYSSHLITSLMTNMGDSEFGPATERKVRVLTIAGCLCRENKIYREWLMRDTSDIVQQLGLDVEALARKQAQNDLDLGSSLIDFHAKRGHLAGISAPKKDALALDPEAVLNAAWKAKPELDGHYFDRCRSFYPGGKDLYSTGQIADFISGIVAALPDLMITVDHICAIPYLDGEQDIAVRFSLSGTHIKDGVYGPASGAPVLIMAACHWRVIHGRIHQEWMVWDDLAVRRQIWTARLLA